jgi:hypothetical protein
MPNTSVNMGLIVPIASTGASGTGDPGPGYASNISNDLLSTIDAHDHSAGKGVQITPAGLNMNADLPMGSNNVTALRAARFTSQASALNLAGDINELYFKSGDLWMVNGSGVQVQVTAGSALATGPVGSTGPAGTSFVTDYFQAGVTGATAMSLIASAAGVQALLPLNNPSLAHGGGITQPTGQGTGSAYLVVNTAGLYEVSYTVGFTGAIPAGQVMCVQQTLNATGSAGGGTAIPQSVAFGSPSGPAQRTYLVQMGQGQNLETWLTNNGIPINTALAQTGTYLAVKRIG